MSRGGVRDGAGRKTLDAKDRRVMIRLSQIDIDNLLKLSTENEKLSETIRRLLNIATQSNNCTDLSSRQIN